MSVVRWNPFREMALLDREMDRLFSRLGGTSGFGTGETNTSQNNSQNQWMLPVDILETQNAVKLRAALPGIDPQDINIEIKDNLLTVSAERRYEDQVEEGAHQWIEQQYGFFSRAITLPKSADTERIEARFNNGMLELLVPKKESAKPRRIELQTADSQPKAIEAGSEQANPETADVSSG